MIGYGIRYGLVIVVMVSVSSQVHDQDQDRPPSGWSMCRVRRRPTAKSVSQPADFEVLAADGQLGCIEGSGTRCVAACPLYRVQTAYTVGV